MNQRPKGRLPVLLNLAGEQLLQTVMSAQPGSHLMVEVPAFMVGDPAHEAALHALHQGGTVLVIKGRPLTALEPKLLELFSHSIVELGEDRRKTPPPPDVVRRITTIQAGAHTTAEINAAFERGAVAVTGWHWNDEPPESAGRIKVPADLGVVMDLINGVEREEPVARLENTLRRDPTLAFRLMRYINSPAFGLSVEITSFGQALALLGYQRLKRWLALLLASSAAGASGGPLMYAAMRRGLLMEALGQEHGDTEMRGELFICGIFSLLDRMLAQPFADLLREVPVPERVAQALRGDGGPFWPYLEMVQAIEQDALFDIRDRAEKLMLGMASVNRAVLVALAAARQLDG